MFRLNQLNDLPRESPVWQVLLDKEQRQILHDLMLGMAVGFLSQDELATDEMCRSRIAKIAFVQTFFNVMPDGTERKYESAENDPLI